jgi:RNase H-fold protein (predicted Holliday junction resolvase)
MKALGIDHGDKRMGIAASDELGMLAHPLEFILCGRAVCHQASRLRAAHANLNVYSFDD